jgi:hypothetical protein
MSKMSEIDMIVTEAMKIVDMGYYVKDAMRIVQDHYRMETDTYDYVYMMVTTNVYGNTA